MQKILIFQQNGSGEAKEAGIRQFGKGLFEIETIEMETRLPLVLDDTSEYLPDHIEADLVLDFMQHQDLSYDLSLLCEKLDIPLVASGKKISGGNALCPPI